MTWTCSSCDDLDARAAEPIREPAQHHHAYGELKRERLDKTAAKMRAANIANRRKRLAAKQQKRREKYVKNFKWVAL